MATPAGNLVETVLNALVAARKSVQLYPRSNPAVDHAVRNLAGAIDAFFAEAPPEGAEGEARHAGVLRFGIERDAFLLPGGERYAAGEAMRKFAADMYRGGIASLKFHRYVAPDDLYRFLAASIVTPQEAARGVRLAARLAECSCEGIGVREAVSLELVEQSAAPERDMADFLRAKAAGREQDADGPADGVDLGDLTDFFLQIAEGSQEVERRLRATLGDPRRLAEVLRIMARRRTESLQSTELPALAMREMLRNIGDYVARLPEAERARYVENVAAALLQPLNNDPRDPIGDWLVEHAGGGGFEDEILEVMSDERVAELITNHVVFHKGTEHTIWNFVDALGRGDARRDAILATVAENLLRSEDARLRETATLLRSEGVPHANVANTASAEARDAQTSRVREFEKLARELLASDEETRAIVGRLEEDLRDASTEHAGRVMLQAFASMPAEGFGAGHSLEDLAALDTFLATGLQEGRYDMVARVVESVPDELGNGAARRVFRTLSRSRRMVTDKDRLDPLLNAFRAVDPASGEYGRLVSLVRFAGTHALANLFDRMVHEPRRSTRLLVVSVFVRLGEPCVPFLTSKVYHRDWFVVRNVAYLLGRIGSPAGVDALVCAGRHSDARVRREAHAALGAIGDGHAETALQGCLHDPDRANRRLVAQWLGNLGGPSSAAALAALLRSHGRQLRRQREWGMAVVQALGRIGGPGELPALVRFQRQCRGILGFIRKDDLTRACDAAAGRLARASTRSGERDDA